MHGTTTLSNNTSPVYWRMFATWRTAAPEQGIPRPTAPSGHARPQAPTPGSAPGVPEWYAEEYAARARDQRVSRRILRDTAVFFAACYAMDGVEVGGGGRAAC